MPSYDYACSCGETFEAIKPLEFRASCICPYCGLTATKVFSPGATTTIVPSDFQTRKPTYAEVAER